MLATSLCEQSYTEHPSVCTNTVVTSTVQVEPSKHKDTGTVVMETQITVVMDARSTVVMATRSTVVMATRSTVMIDASTCHKHRLSLMTDTRSVMADTSSVITVLFINISCLVSAMGTALVWSCSSA